LFNRVCWLGEEKEEDALAGEVFEREFLASSDSRRKAGGLWRLTLSIKQSFAIDLRSLPRIESDALPDQVG